MRVAEEIQRDLPNLLFTRAVPARKRAGLNPACPGAPPAPGAFLAGTALDHPIKSLVPD